MNIPSNFTEYLELMKNIQYAILSYIDEEDSQNDIINFTKITEYELIKKDMKVLIEFLHLIAAISNNHHRTNNFFNKIEKIISFYKNEIKEIPQDHLLDIFIENKRVLLFLFNEKLLIPNEHIAKMLETKKYKRYFYPMFESLFSIITKQDSRTNQTNIWGYSQSYYPQNYYPKSYYLQNYYPQSYYPQSYSFGSQNNYSMINLDDYKDLEKFKENCLIGENHNYISTLIRNDSIEEFVQYTNKMNTDLNMKIDYSIFETNMFLIDKNPTLIEYAAFFGSLKIINYLRMNNVQITKSIGLYAVHGRNGDLIHLLESYNVIDGKSDLIKEAIKCHHSELINYFNIENQNDNIFIQEYYDYYNYEFMPEKINISPVNLVQKDYLFHVYFGVLIFNVNSEISYFKNSNKKGTLLHMAVDFNNYLLFDLLKDFPNLDVNKYLINNTSEYNLVEEKTALHIAVENNSAKMVEKLLSLEKIDPNILEKFTKKKYMYIGSVYPMKRAALHIAIQNKQQNIVNLLLTHNQINVNIIENSYMMDKNKYFHEYMKSPLYLAIDSDDQEVVRQLLSNDKINVNQEYIHTKVDTSNELLFISKNTPLIFAIKENKQNIVHQLLLHENIDINYKSIIRAKHSNEFKITNEKTALYISVYQNNTDIVKLILENESLNINDKLFNEEYNQQTCIRQTMQTVLHTAIMNSNEKIVQQLLSNDKINVNEIFSENKREAKKNNDMVYNKMTPLFLAVEKGNIFIVQQLISNKNIDINAISSTIKNLGSYKSISIDEKTALHNAIITENEIILDQLLSHKKIDINIKQHIESNDNQIWEYTSLYLAISTGNNEIIKKVLNNPFLLINDLSTDISNSEEHHISALNYAIQMKNVSVVQEILKHDEFNVNTKSIFKKTVITRKNEREQLSVFSFSMNSTTSKEIKETLSIENEITALQFAIDQQNPDIVQILLKDPKIDVNIKSIYTKETIEEIKKGPDQVTKTQCKSKKEKTALLLAVEKQDQYLVNYLLNHEKINTFMKIKSYKVINGTQKIKKDKEIFYVAVKKGNMEIIQQLINRQEIDTNAYYSIFSIESFTTKHSIGQTTSYISKEIKKHLCTLLLKIIELKKSKFY